MFKKLQQFLRDLDPETPAQNHHHEMQLAAATLLVELARADHSEQAVELESITKALAATFELLPSELAELMDEAASQADESISLHPLVRLFNASMSMPDKVELIKMMWQVACADGHIDKYEDHLIRRTAELLYVSHADFIRTKQQVLRERGNE